MLANARLESRFLGDIGIGELMFRSIYDPTVFPIKSHGVILCGCSLTYSVGFMTDQKFDKQACIVSSCPILEIF